MRRTALVTGALRGIGRAIALRLSSGGMNVAICGTRSSQDAADDLKELNESGIMYRKCDVSDKTERAALIDGVLSSFGTLDVLVNNAGIAPPVRADILETSEDSFDKVLSVNLKAPYFLCQAAAKAMIRSGGGIIINIESISSYAVSVTRGEYCVSKAGLSMVTKLFAARLAEENIRVYGVRPGIIATDMTSAVTEKYDKLIDEGLTPIKRWGKPSDTAEAVALLTEGRLPFSTGETINVDGGFHIARL